VENHPWKFESYHPALKPVLPAVKQFCVDAMSRHEPYWLSILGPSGIGKTYILRQATRFLERYDEFWRQKTATGFRTPSVAHVEPLRDLEDYGAIKHFAGFDLLYVEDIGAGAAMGQKGSGAVMRDRIASLLQQRTRSWTLICANLGREEIADKIDARIASRLKRDGSVMIELDMSIPDFNG
jgi:DNA replication protein DnaC